MERRDGGEKIRVHRMNRVKKTEWVRGKGKITPAKRAHGSIREDKTEYKSFEDYIAQKKKMFGRDFRIRCHENLKTYSVEFERRKR